VLGGSADALESVFVKILLDVIYWPHFFRQVQTSRRLSFELNSEQVYKRAHQVGNGLLGCAVGSLRVGTAHADLFKELPVKELGLLRRQRTRFSHDLSTENVDDSDDFLDGIH
jgi:hypothetical protein